ncbi:MAG: hypothetical protein OXL38_20180 [Gammaproteobacteria bacterium]|nr:hypothetical protein [Gammaproteobacteria bacterium]
MKRDMDLVRELLLRVEAGSKRSKVETERESAESHHLWLLKDAGYIASFMNDWPLRKV